MGRPPIQDETVVISANGQGAAWSSEMPNSRLAAHAVVSSLLAAVIIAGGALWLANA